MSYKKAAEVRRAPSSVFAFDKLPDFGMKTPLRPFQVQGMFFLDEAKKCILADATGLGKTAQCIALFQWLEKKGVSDNRWLLVVPPTTMLQWAGEFEKFSSLSTPVVGIYGRQQRISAYVHEFWQFMLVSYQVLQRDWEMIDRLGIKNWVLDDAHFFRHHNTKTARIVKHLTHDADRVVLTTATPMQKDPRDLHSLLEVLGLNHIFGTVTGFTNHFCKIRKVRCAKRDGTHYSKEEFLGIRNKEELKRRINPFIILRSFQDVGDELPALSVQPVFLQMHPKQRDLYSQLRKKILKAFDSGVMSNTEILNKGFQTMRKVCDGTRALGMKEDISVKMDSTMHFIQNRLGREKLLVYTFYKANVETLCNRLREAGRYDFATFTGDDSSVVYREETKKKFLDPDSGLNILIGTDALRVGLNLQSARYLIMLDLILNAQETQQLIGRIRRMGGHAHVVVYPLVTQGTIEEALYRSLRYEAALFDAVFEQTTDAFPSLTALELATMLRG